MPNVLRSIGTTINMKTPNQDTIKPIDPAKATVLGQKISDHPSFQHRTATPKIVGVALILLTVILIYLILGQGWSYWWFLLAAVLGAAAYICFERQRIVGMSVYENGIAFFEDTEPEARILTWQQLEFGETDWGDYADFFFIERATGQFIPSIDTKRNQCDKEELCKILHEQPKEQLFQFWTQSIENGQSVEYNKVILQPDGVHFKKIDRTLSYHDFDVWSVNDDWEVVYQTKSGAIFEPKLYTYHIPYVEVLFEFAKSRSHST